MTVTHAVASADARYTYITRSGENVTVTIEDDMPRLVGSAATAGLAVEEGVSGTYTVVLDTEPTAPVTVAIASSKMAVTGAPGALTFSATAQADADAVDERVTLTHTLTGAAEYAGSTGVAAVTVNAVTVRSRTTKSRS